MLFHCYLSLFHRRCRVALTAGLSLRAYSDVIGEDVDICRMQLMVYKCLWDNIVTRGLPFRDFFEHFRLRPQHLLSDDVRIHAAEIFPDAKVGKLLQTLALIGTQPCFNLVLNRHSV